MDIREGLCYDDVLLVPQYSEIKSRSKVDLSVQLPKGIKLSNPIIPANMKTITGEKMATAIADMGGMAILHRFMPLEEQLDIANNFVLKSQSKNNVDYTAHIGYSVGIQKRDREAVYSLKEIGWARIICIDVAHGDSSMAVEMCGWIASKYPEMLIIAGNVATGSAARRLWEAGADVVKVGIGPGSLCTTRIETGNGVPQLTAVMDVAAERDRLRSSGIAKWQKSLPIIADGGIKSAGDCVKSLAFADMVMAGNLFAGAIETPGAITQNNGIQYKEYIGSSTHKINHIEGVSAIVPVKGHVEDILKTLLEGIRSGCSYQGSANLNELKDNPQFIKITNSGLRESHHHDVVLK